MKNKFYILVYILLAFMTFFIAYNFYTTKNRQVNKKTILNLKNNAFSRYKEDFNMSRNFGYIWGLQNQQVKVDENETNETAVIATKILTVTQNKSSLCVKKDCFRFLGLFYKKNRPYISLYNKSFKHKINDFTIGENIAYTLYIKEIEHNEALLGDTNSSREWKFKLFDVNTTKYKPKDINETYI